VLPSTPAGRDRETARARPAEVIGRHSGDGALGCQGVQMQIQHDQGHL
jgi:hypothetical protein